MNLAIARKRPDAILRHATRVAGALLALAGTCTWAADAEIVSVTGKGDKRETAQADWTPAQPKQTVRPGGFVRTRELSQMALLLPDRTQLRLNQNSQMQIKTVAEAAEFTQNAVRLNAGRAWSQARPAGAAPASGAPAKLTMETPSATLSIRGTDWEVEVAPDGRTQLVVLSGEIDMTNEQGGLKVGAGEAATAEPGKAPVRLQIVNPAERIQWVTAWAARPRRWVPQPDSALRRAIDLLQAGEFADARAMLGRLPPDTGRDLVLADLLSSQGDFDQAEKLLAPLAQEGAGHPRATALLARIHLAQGNAKSASTLLAKARAAHPADIEVRLASAETNIFQGDAAGARGELSKALTLDGSNADAWLVRGGIETERENVGAAREALDAALKAQPGLARAMAERGTLETLAGDFAAARSLYNKALETAPDDYVALTGRGILHLKAGETSAALEDFLRAGVIEPRYGRALLYSGAAFYQLGETRRAEDALHKAAALDPRDPMPWVILGLIATDRLDLGKAADLAREAQQRMPYVKSLNQVLNNQKGSANVGSALAAFGMETWGRSYAVSAYSPWWAGSHLFLADRSPAGFNRNSELFKGFLTDPTVFGVSPRLSSLVPVPGQYARADLYLEQADWAQGALIGTVNGMAVSPFPVAYFVSGDLSTGYSRLVSDRANSESLTVGLGARPSHALGVFAFGTHSNVRGDLNSATLPNDPLGVDDSRVDLGANLRLDSTNQVWLKGGAGRNTAMIHGRVAIPAVVRLYGYQSHVEQTDLQFRHAWAPVDDAWLTWGYEESRQEKPAVFDVQATAATRLVIREVSSLKSRDGYLLARFPATTTLRGEIGAFAQRASSRVNSERRANGAILGTPVNNAREFSETNWRGGLQWQFGPQSALTAASQRWRRPAGVASLAPGDTLGIALNDQLVTNGGLYRRNRIQIDHEASATTFLHGFADRESVINLTSPSTAVVPDLQLTQLDSLRGRRDAFTVQPELEAAPQFLEGWMSSVGFAVNQRLGHDQTVAVSYRRANAQQTGTRDGKHIPYVPRQYLRLASHWSLPERWLLGMYATWRSERYRDEANNTNQRINPDWALGASVYWESADKRWIFQGILDNIRADHNSSDDRAAKLILRASYLY